MDYLSSEEELIFDSKYKVLYFYATWMNFHTKFCSMISSYQDKNPDFKFIAIDVDHYKNLCKRFEVTSIPTIIAFVDGKEVKRFSGMMLTSAFKSLLNDIYNKHKEKNNVKRK